MITAENSEIDIRLRRYKKELYTTGMGYILFGIWSVLKVIMSVFLGELMLENVFPREESDPQEYMIIRIVYTLFIFIVALVVFLIHLRVGLGAIKASRGAKKSRYLILAVILLVINIISLRGYSFRNNGGEISDTQVASFLVDITVTMLLVGMCWSDHMMRKLTKEKEQST